MDSDISQIVEVKEPVSKICFPNCRLFEKIAQSETVTLPDR